MVTHNCAVCGRSVDTLPEAQEQAGLSFCSHSHYLDWESRRRRLRRRYRTSGVVVVVTVIGFALLLAFNQTSGESTLDRYAKQTPAQVRTGIKNCFERHGYRVYRPSEIDPYEGNYASDGVVFLTKVHKPSGRSI